MINTSSTLYRHRVVISSFHFGVTKGKTTKVKYKQEMCIMFEFIIRKLRDKSGLKISAVWNGSSINHYVLFT